MKRPKSVLYVFSSSSLNSEGMIERTTPYNNQNILTPKLIKKKKNVFYKIN